MVHLHKSIFYKDRLNIYLSVKLKAYTYVFQGAYLFNKR